MKMPTVVMLYILCSVWMFAGMIQEMRVKKVHYPLYQVVGAAATWPIFVCVSTGQWVVDQRSDK